MVLKRPDHGITIVESLIVIAAVALLAVIAIPRFAEADDRSRWAKQGMIAQTIVTAMESYATDNAGAYAPNSERGQSLTGTGYHARLSNYLTTPIAYLVTLPHDPYLGTSSFSSGTYPASSDVGRRYVYYNTPQTIQASGGSDVWGGLENWVGKWLVMSAGPDRTYIQGPASTLIPYDPTNGAVSLGNIIRCQKHEDSIPVHPITNDYKW